ncbi:MAG TPA: SRPBCC domain-containing protein, partial [Acidimicrobiales bacterium]|nr:SRPBCC domain-containing protein [Acidimicrobiales bacterium]
MIQRQVVVPAASDRLWRALTDPDEAGTWLGGDLDWKVEEGQPLRFTPFRPTADEPVREGRVEQVEPGRYLRFRWRPSGGGADSESEVAYVLEPAGADPDQTVLTVEEVPVPATPALASAVAPAMVV